MTGSGYTFILASWRHESGDIRSVREQVLCEELGFDWRFGDEATEASAFHLLVYDGAGRAVGAARMQPDGAIDYIAVLRPWRGVTVGGAMLAYLVHVAQVQHLPKVSAMVPPAVQRFFEKNGFIAAGQPAAPGAAARRLLRSVPSPGSRSHGTQ